MEPKTRFVGITLALSMMGLSACGSSDTPAASSTSSSAAPSSSMTSSTTAPPSTAGSMSSSATSSTAMTSTSTAMTSASPASETTAASSVETSAAAGSTGAGAAANGSIIKAGVATSLPAAVGDWTAPSGSSGPGTIYDNGDKTLIVSFQSGAEYQGMVESITADNTPAGSGTCGSSNSADNLVCYLATADGVLTVSADAGDTPLADLIQFADTLTTTLGVQ